MSGLDVAGEELGEGLGSFDISCLADGEAERVF